MRNAIHATIGAMAVCSALSLLGCTRADTAPPPVPEAATRRVTQQGEVVGLRAAYGSDAWLGIPFAQPPVGALRWRAPQPPERWSGTRQALAFGSPCTQYASPFGGVVGRRPGDPVGSEDCLYLNIYTPRFPSAAAVADAHLPVMVWIHGGGNTIGEGGFYNGGNLATSQNVVVLTVNYRLGPFGWLRHAALRADAANDAERSGNFGTLDLVQALRWVRDNIAGFGGDPGNVTIFGESAGGTNVFSLLLSPEARGLFQRAIVESGGFFFNTPAAAENFTDDGDPGQANSSGEMLTRLLVRDHRAGDRAAAKVRLAAMAPQDIAAYLRGKSNIEILTAYDPIPGVDMIQMPLVFRDGTVLPSDNALAVFARADAYNHVPVILGTNRDENKLFMFGDPKNVRQLFWFIPRLRDERHYNLSAEYLARMWKATGADEPAAAMRATQGPNVYVYRFDWSDEPHVLGADLSVMLGAAHGFEIPFVFGHFDLGKRGNVIFSAANEPGRKLLSAQMMSYWTEFAAHGAPGRGRDGRLPEWQAWGDGAGQPKFMILDSERGGGVRMSSDALTGSAVIAAVDTDPRLATPRDKCMIYHDLASWSRGFTKKDYAAAGHGVCAPYPFDAYPWS